MPRPRSSSIALFLAVSLALAGPGCSQKSDDSSPAQSASAQRNEAKMDSKRAEEAPTGAAAPSPMSASAEEAKKEDGGGGPGGAKGGATTWKKSVAQPNTSQLSIGDNETLPIRGMQLRSQIDGFRARVLIDFYFFNPNPQQYEGTFKLRLPDGASPLFFAFGQSAWSATPTDPVKYDEPAERRKGGFEPAQIEAERKAKWVDPKIARMVPKEQAAHAYGETVRRAVDPALLEWAGAGVFNARVFPIAPYKLHRVVVAYDMDLTAIGDDLEMQIPIPPDLPSSAIDLNIAAPKGVKLTVSPESESEVVDGRSYHRLENVSGKTLTVRLDGAARSMLVGNEPETGPYFAAALAPELPAAPKTTTSRRAVLAIDTSMSTNPDGFGVWMALCKALLDNNRATPGGIDEVAVMFFDTDAVWWKSAFVPNTAENAAAVIAHAETLVLEGATDLGAALDAATHPAWLPAGEPGFDLFVLSDGGVTWGESDRHAIAARLADGRATSLFAYRTGIGGGDGTMLDHLARERGGAVFSVTGEAEVAAASTAHRARPWAIEDVRVAGGSDVLLAGRPKALFPGQRILVTGRGNPSKGAAIELDLAQDGTKQTVRVPMATVVSSDLTARAYGQQAVGQLEDFGSATESVATAYARHFRVAGQTTSLLMLESEADYQRFGIVPANDIGVVTERPVDPLVTRAIEALATELGDPKAAFVERIRKLEKMPGAEVKLPAELDEIMKGLPSHVFAIAAQPLLPKQQTRDGIPKDVLDQLAAQKPEYDTIVGESERRLAAYGADDALEALGSLVEASPGDGVLARDIGFSAMQLNHDEQAYALFSRVATARPWEPQTYRALALSAAESGRGELALLWFELALAGRWDSRFGEFQAILLQDYLRFLNGDMIGKLDPILAGYARSRLPDIRAKVGIDEADIVVTIAWNTDNTDVDLHVVEPSGEECFFSHPNTRSGGRLTRDVTQGYGPEMYVLAKAPAGKYQVRAKYFASDSNRASARTKVYATIIRDFGRKTEQVEDKVIVLERGKDMHDLVTIAVDG